MRRIFLAALIFVRAVSFAFTESSGAEGHQLAFSVSLGMLSGEVDEIVFLNNVSDDKLSELSWDIKPLFYAGLDLHYNWQRESNLLGFFSDLRLKIGIPGETGIMRDRDWFYVRAGVEHGSYPFWLNYYSEHDNITRAAVLADIAAGPAFVILDGISLKTFLSYSFMYYSWEAQGGSRLYYGDHYYWPSSQTIISYKQFWHIFSPGLSFYGELNRFFALELSIKWSPLVWITAEDNHILRNLVVTDTPSGGLFVEPGLVFSLRSTSFLTFSLFYSYRKISGSRGDSVYRIGGTFVGEYSNAAGANYGVHNIGILARCAVWSR